MTTCHIQFNQKFAGLARLGYDNLDYPLQPGASIKSPSWSLGGHYTPSPGQLFDRQLWPSGGFARL